MKNAQLTFIPPTESQPATVLLEGELVLCNAEEARRELLHWLHQVDELHVEVINVADIDLSFMQLLLAFRRSAQNLSKQLKMKMEFREELQTLMAQTGLIGTEIADTIK